MSRFFNIEVIANPNEIQIQTEFWRFGNKNSVTLLFITLLPSNIECTDSTSANLIAPFPKTAWYAAYPAPTHRPSQ